MLRAMFSILLFLFISGCGGSRAEYYASHPEIGVRVSFKKPMAYLTNLPPGYGDREMVRIGRNIYTTQEAESVKQFIRMARDVVVVPIPAGATFEVIAVFRVVKKGYSRFFASDYDVAVLRDNEGNISTMTLIALTGIPKDKEEKT